MIHQHPLPDGWAIKPLGDPSLATINPRYDLPGGPYPFVPMDVVANGFAGIEYFESVQDASGGYSRFRDGDILFAKITPCAENGKIALVEGIGDKLGLGSTEFHVIRPAKGVNNRFLYYLVSCGHVHRLAVSLMEGTTGRQRIPISIFRKRLSAPIPLDSLEQEKIASILSKVDEAIQATRETIARAERLKTALMQNLLTGKLRPDETWRKEEDFYTDEKFGNIPKGWEIKKGYQITEKITKGQSPKWQGYEYQASGVLFITSENVLDGKLDISSPKYLPVKFNEKIKGSQLQQGDILINIVGASIGRSCIYNLDNQISNINQAVCLFRLKKKFVNAYFSYYLQLPQTLNKLLCNQVETARANLSLGDFRKFKFVFPESQEEQSAIAEKIGSVVKIIHSKHTKIQKLERLKKALMQNLLTGKVRVKIEK